MRLIDADYFEKFIHEHCQDSLVDLWCELVKMQPTAYDMDNVVERLKEEKNQAWDLCDGGARYSAYDNALEIVRSGIN